MNSNIVTYSPFNTCLASPIYCQKLFRLGLNKSKTFIAWIGRNGQIAPESLWFDKDDYYRDALPAINAITPPELAYPAFTIGDMALLIPSFTLSVEEGLYNCRLNKTPEGFKATNHLRMADALAMMLIQCIERNYLQVASINTYLQAN